ncbi:MAG: hypothetical protein RR369_03990 [Lachnospiraceae bacterium]
MSRVTNCYNTGRVAANMVDVGGIAGESNDGNSNVHACYYLKDCAMENGTGRTVTGVGGIFGGRSDKGNGRNLANFTAADSELSRNTGYGRKSLIEVLNVYIATDAIFANYYSLWVEGADKYPTMEGIGVTK